MLAGFAGVSALGIVAGKAWAGVNFNFIKKKDDDFPYELTEDQWREKLSLEAYKVLREEGTEPANSSPLNKEKREGIYACAGCDNPVYSSEAKYESGSGWPSFFQPIDKDAIGKSTDFKIIVPRTEVHCANCGGHLGHVFDDGPAPTGLRYCMNGIALSFKPA